MVGAIAQSTKAKSTLHLHLYFTYLQTAVSNHPALAAMSPESPSATLTTIASQERWHCLI